MKWHRISDYAITNGREFSGPDNAYRHGTHIISMAQVNNSPRFTLWKGDRMLAIRDTAEELRKLAEERLKPHEKELA